MLILPRNLAVLTKAAASDSARFALSAVRLQDTGNGTYLAEATDGRILARVTGTNATNPDDFPPIPALAAAPNSGTETLVPVADWTRAFAAIPKPKKRSNQPQTLATACVIGEQKTTFGAVNAGTVAVTEADRPGTGTGKDYIPARYPRTDEVFPKAARYAFAVNPKLLANVLEIAATFTDAEDPCVTIEVYDSTAPILVKARSMEAAQTFEGLIVPLTLDKATAARVKDNGTVSVKDYESLTAALAAETKRANELYEELANLRHPGRAAALALAAS
jgi:hypothetical protein